MSNEKPPARKGWLAIIFMNAMPLVFGYGDKKEAELVAEFSNANWREVDLEHIDIEFKVWRHTDYEEKIARQHYALRPPSKWDIEMVD